jgi:hypothetical protein
MGPAGVGTGRAEAADRGVDESRVAFPGSFATDPEAIDDAGVEILHDDVGTGKKVEDELRALVAREIDGDRALAAVVVEKQRRHPRTADRSDAHDVAEPDRLDLDDVGSLLRHDHGPQRP